MQSTVEQFSSHRPGFRKASTQATVENQSFFVLWTFNICQESETNSAAKRR